MEQLDLFTQPTGEQLRDAGMQQAVDHADRVSDQWSDKAYKYLCIFLQHHSEPFMTEEFRAYCERYKLPEPPSLRAYGSVIVRASKAGLIKKVGIQSVSNPKAHCANANLWVKSY